MLALLLPFRSEVAPLVSELAETTRKIADAIVSASTQIAASASDETPYLRELSAVSSARSTCSNILYNINSLIDQLATYDKPDRVERYFISKDGDIQEATREEYEAVVPPIQEYSNL